MTVDLSDETVLVTGASSGIGRAFALALAEAGANVVLVARRADRLEALAQQIASRQSGTATPIQADLTGSDSAARLRAEIERRGITITGLINNAGFGTWGPFLDEDLDRVEDEISLDIAAPVRLAHAFLPSILDAGTGFLINVASMAAYQPTPRMAVYGAAKAFILSFTEALWAELRDTGVTVFALSPGATATEFNDVVGTDNATAGARMRTPEDVVATALAHLGRRNPGPSIADGRANRAAAAMSRLIPRRTAVTMMGRMTDPARRDKAPRE